MVEGMYLHIILIPKFAVVEIVLKQIVKISLHPTENVVGPHVDKLA